MHCAVTTTPDRSQYMDETLHSLAQGGFEEVTLCYDSGGPSTLEQPGHPTTWVTSSPIRVGSKANFKLGLWHLIGDDLDYCIVFQDDVIVSRGLCGYLDLPAKPLANAVYMLYCTPGMECSYQGFEPFDLEPKINQPFPWKKPIGACGVLMDKETAELFLENDPLPQYANRIGQSLAKFCYLNNIPMIRHTPSLVQHIGKDSNFPACSPYNDRQATNFCEDVSEL